MAETKEDRHALAVLTDIVMLVLISVNLLLILFEWFYSAEVVQDLFAQAAPAVQEAYHENIHANFFWIDLGFIAIYLTEIFIQWIVAVGRRTYRRWWYYPFANWYDVLGCIPIATFRFFRVLRVFSLIVKMQRLEVIDLRNTFFYRAFLRYWAAISEELSDRVVMNVLTAIQEEVKLGSPVTEEIGRRVIDPRREAIVEAISFRLQNATQQAYAHYRPDVRRYVDRLIKDAVDTNQELRAIHSVPVVGRQVGGLVERAVSDIVYSVVNDLVEDVASAENKAVVNHVAQISADTLFKTQGRHNIDEEARQALIEAIDVVKEHVRRKKERDDQALADETRRIMGSVVEGVERPDEGEERKRKKMGGQGIFRRRI